MNATVSLSEATLEQARARVGELGPLLIEAHARAQGDLILLACVDFGAVVALTEAEVCSCLHASGFDLVLEKIAALQPFGRRVVIMTGDHIFTAMIPKAGTGEA